MRYRHLRRTAIAVLAAVAFVLILALLAGRALNSLKVRTAVAGWLESAARGQGVELELGSLSWGIVPPRVIVEDVVVTGSEFTILLDRLEVELTRIRLARRIVELRTVAADGVRVRLDGLPRAAARRGRSPFRVMVRHLDLRNVELEGEGFPGRIDLAVTGASLVWVTEQGTPSGFLSARRAVVSAPALEPIELALQSRVIVAEGLRFPAWRLDGEGLSMAGNGALTGGALRLDAAGSVQLEQLASTIRSPGLLLGRLRVAAALDTSADELVRLEFSAPQLTASGFTFDDVAARLTVERDRLSGVLDGAGIFGGHLTGTYRLEHLKGPSRPHQVQVSGEGLSLAGFLGHLEVPSGGLGARVGIGGELSWNGRAIEHSSGRFLAELRPAASGLPTRGTVAVELTPDGLMRFEADKLGVGRSVVDWQGPLTLGTWQPDWSLRAAPADLAEVVSLVNSFVGSEVLPPWISGQGTLIVTLSGPWQNLVVGARLDARPLQLLPPVQLDQLLAEATISGSRLVLGPTLFRVGDGTGEVDGAISWGEGPPDDQLDLAIRGFRIPAATVAGWAGAPGQAAGVLSFTGGLRGSIAAPRGSWAVGFDEARLLGQGLGGGTAAVDLAGGRFDARALSFEGGLVGSAWWDTASGGVGGRLRWPGMSLDALGEELSDLAGGTADLELDFEMAREVPTTGRLRLDAPAAVVDVVAGPGAVTVDAALAKAAVLSATLQRLGDGALEGGGELRVEDVATLIAHLAPGATVPLTGAAQAAFRTRWPAGGLPTVEGALESADLELDGRPVQLLEPSPFRLSPKGAEFDGLHLAIRSDELFARCSLGADGALAGNVAGTLDALLLRILLPDWEPAGRATGVVELLGTLGEPRFEGIADVRQASFRIPGTRTIVSGIDGTVLLSSNEIELEGVDFRFMQGRGRCSGRIGRRDGAVDIALDGTADAIRYEVLPDVVAQLSGAWRLVGPADRLELSGDLAVDSAVLRTKDDLASLVLRWLGGESPPAATGGGLALDLHVDADETIELRNPSIRLVGSASLDVSGTINRPGLVGKLQFEEGGEVMLQTLRYEIERAALTFSDPQAIDPFIEIQARTFVQNYDITLRLTGTTQRLVPSVSSNPPLTEDEIYGLMAVGYRSEGATSGAMGIGLASSILSQQLAAELDRRAGLSLPVDQVRVDPFAETSTGDPGAARITVVKQLNPAWTVTVQSNLSGEREEVVVSRWYLAPGVFFEASRDLDGTYGVDLKLRRQY
ncbi:MAG TPA: translocation/assembly module TamB domain-containing protein [Thermoanaerobaculales bacterium]|nr:translocation/assembly module TamB domain-containing protein [Thermoanaerobaculales bacterium]HPA80396.1 translocation/assembly module TamB domain-containing protein [Thermoanaerobaculales bacterium]HQL30041.1 translocation/assembly module TamB domain-containing protein [Thermoanaerobaculales bacterium]HQN96817.1 translocation/assembly module TamB domain-containing protein [Thermoanaerobaculales bacterium]HQP43812.1 translocation/assembly module TamB domain-containing protein [Thermoanaeroba